MSSHSSWQYDEFKQIGKDYGKQSEVDVYDSSHADFRDIEKESNDVLDLLDLQPGDTVIDFGSGTGTFAVQAALRGLNVHAVDVSETMIAHAKKKAEAISANISFHHAGFLTYEHRGEPVSAITTSLAFHHLPDFWKGVALKRLYKMLKPGGSLYLYDVILTENNPLNDISIFIKKQEAAGGEFLKEDAEEHFREEFSTYDWIIEGLLSRAGFKIQQKTLSEGVFGTYLCQRDTF